jgi:hypothetical protein
MITNQILVNNPVRRGKRFGRRRPSLSVLTNRTLQPWNGGVLMKAVEGMRPTRTVTFDESQNQIISPDLHGRTEEETQSAWWSGDDYYQFCIEYRQYVRDCREYRSDWIEDLMCVIKRCNASYNVHDMEAEVFLIHDEIRGMETDVAPVLKHLRRKHSQAVLQYMHRIPKRFNLHLRERMLAARSMQLSRPLTIFAYVAGQADCKATKQKK